MNSIYHAGPYLPTQNLQDSSSTILKITMAFRSLTNPHYYYLFGIDKSM